MTEDLLIKVLEAELREGVKKMDYSIISKVWEELPEGIGNKFNIGDKVFYPDMLNVYEVKGVNYMGDDNGIKIFEYALSGYPFLVYEDELEIPTRSN